MKYLDVADSMRIVFKLKIGNVIKKLESPAECGLSPLGTGTILALPEILFYALKR
jgi:hypothetical protein